MNNRAGLNKTCVADALLDYLHGRGVRHVFVVPGMQIDPLVRALANHATLTPILANHELAAGYMADGYARASGGIGATFAIGGPGCANLVGAAVAAKADRSPVLFVTGNIPLAAQGRGEFQDAGPQGSNDAGIFDAAVGCSLNCAVADGLSTMFAQVERQLQARRPAHVGIAMDVQMAEVGLDRGVSSSPAPDAEALSSIPPRNDWLANDRVLLVVGVEALAVADAVRSAVTRFNWAVATDSGARGIMDEGECHALGHLGFMPHPRALAALSGDGDHRAGGVLALGCDDRLVEDLRARHGDVRVLTVAEFAALQACGSSQCDRGIFEQRRDWLQKLAHIQRPPARSTVDREAMAYAEVVDAVATSLPHDAAFVVDAGQVRRIAVSRLRCRQPHTLFVAEGMAPMGWSLGAAIGVKLACPGRTVVALLGDGAMRMHGIELATAARHGLPILYVLFDNGAYGSVLARMEGDAEQETARLPAVDWRAFAAAFGVEATIATDAGSLRMALDGVASLAGPRLIIARVPAIEPDAYGEATGIDWALGSVAQSRIDT